MITALLLGFLLVSAIRVDVRNNEVWLEQGGQPKQLTTDRKAKIQAVLSPSGNRTAYYEECPESEHCSLQLCSWTSRAIGYRHSSPRFRLPDPLRVA